MNQVHYRKIQYIQLVISTYTIKHGLVVLERTTLGKLDVEKEAVTKTNNNDDSTFLEQLSTLYWRHSV